MDDMADLRMQLIVDADVYAPEPLGIRHLMLGGGRILWMGTDRPALPPELQVEVIDLGGRRMIPGLVDCHAHVTGGGGESGYGSSIAPLEAREFTSCGITAIVGLLGTDDCVRTTGQLVHAVNGLRSAGLAAWCYTGGYHLPPTTLLGSIRSDMVHVDPIIGFGELAISDHRSSQPSLDDVLRVASEVHVAGLMTGKAGILHLHLGDGPRGLDLVRSALDKSELPARVFHPTHVNRRRALFEEALALTSRGVTVDVTAEPEEDSRAAPGSGPDAELPASYAIRALLSSDVEPTRWTVSSDSGGCLPTFDAEGHVHSYEVGRPAILSTLLAGLLTEGLSLAKVLPGFTSNPADLLRLKEHGRIAIGSRADLVCLEDETHAVRDVWCKGTRSSLR
ncbi:MAG: beta-aspartyl-dipeptidase (metallo-type) [Planctomycetota bacterium]